MGASGSEVTFNPQAPANPTRGVIAPAVALRDVACPSLTQCVADYGPDPNGSRGVITFDPQVPSGPTQTVLGKNDGGQLHGIDCPTTTECLVVDSGETDEANSPNANTPYALWEGAPGASSSAWNAEAVSGFANLNAVSCPSAAECVAVGFQGDETTGTLGSTGSPSSGSGSQAGKVSLGKTRVSGDVASAMVTCPRSAPKPCRVSLALDAVETTRGARVIAVQASAGSRSKRKRTVILGRSTASQIAPGAHRTIKVSLGPAGRALLARFGHLKIQMVVTSRSGSSPTHTVVRTLSFRAMPIRRHG